MPSPSDLYSRWSLAMRRGRVFTAGDRAGVAVSGGQDSVLLLHFMRQLASEEGFRTAAVHFNHRLRGAESNEDERFVALAAGELKIDYLHAGADVSRIAHDRKQNLEATARELRYRYFFSLIRQGKLSLVATAHTANDQAETLLLRLLRGAGTRGLGGIYPALRGGIVRPFLQITRAEVEKEVRKRGLTFRFDRSNLDLRFTRNKVRIKLLPLLEKEFNPRIVPLLAGLADRSRDDEAWIEHQAAELSRPWRVREGREERIAIRAWRELHPALGRRVLRQMIEAAVGGLNGITSLHLEELRRWSASAQSGKALFLPAGIEACREFEWLAIRQANGNSAPRAYSLAIVPPAKADVGGILLKFNVVEVTETPQDNALSNPGWTYNRISQYVYIDLDKFKGDLLLRNWRPGDRFRPAGRASARKVKELFLERRIPSAQRASWPVLLCGEEIVWVRGFPPCASAAVTDSTRRALRIEEAASETAAPR
ncbi:MAG: tRNA lysidine(34) synthetase TilS [Acidobacteriota bacterium]|nr:tRNA lysidine(34) synthetase TilS [Acidobacteriota bacterium]